MGKIIELIPNSEGIARAAKLLLPTKNIINRPLNLLYPLECETETKTESTENTKDRRETKTKTVNENNSKQLNISERKPRKAAMEARDKIFGQNLQDDQFTSVVGMS